MGLSGESLIVLNDDTVVCEGCYEVNAPSETAPETDFGKFPMGRTDHGECATCGHSLRGRSE